MVGVGATDIEYTAVYVAEQLCTSVNRVYVSVDDTVAVVVITNEFVFAPPGLQVNVAPGLVTVKVFDLPAHNDTGPTIIGLSEGHIIITL